MFVSKLRFLRKFLQPVQPINCRVVKWIRKMLVYVVYVRLYVLLNIKYALRFAQLDLRRQLGSQSPVHNMFYAFLVVCVSTFLLYSILYPPNKPLLRFHYTRSIRFLPCSPRNRIHWYRYRFLYNFCSTQMIH
uniref:Uncharacterized protein n=1 Tax=Myoviridae sp. ct9Ns12 TaxID=2826626 RepID=A0A8S5MHC0_9CAUD|nr:MAG TPA: hypothetical protein [Myoviridae sp. ct9Ns12]